MSNESFPLVLHNQREEDLQLLLRLREFPHCHVTGRKNTNNTIHSGWIPFSCLSFRVLVLCMLDHWCSKLSYWDTWITAFLMRLVEPVLFPISQPNPQKKCSPFLQNPQVSIKHDFSVTWCCKVTFLYSVLSFPCHIAVLVLWMG